MKNRLGDLAIFGGAPAFDEPLHVGCPNIGDRDRLLQRIGDLLDRKWLTNNGPFVRELEEQIAKRTGAKNAIALCNGTVALEIAIRAADLAGEVIVPSFTFIATAHALQWQQITPVFCDIDPSTHTIDPQRVEELITPRTTGIIGVHTWGRPCDIDALSEIAERRQLSLLFDAAHAFGCSYRERPIGNFGRAEVFSFHATKFCNAFEGGAITTNDDELAAKIRLMQNFGFAGYDNVVYVGTNGKMNEVCAAMGLTSLESMHEFVQVNRRNYKLYQAGIEAIPGIGLLEYAEADSCNYQYIVAMVDEPAAGVSRDEIVQVLHAENIIARRYFYPGCHNMQPYRSQFPNAGLALLHTERVAERVLVLPTGTSIGANEIEEILQILRLATKGGRQLRQQLGKAERRAA